MPTSETDDGLPYSEMALIGIKALQKRTLEIAKSVYSELFFKTTLSASLGLTLLRVCFSIICLVLLGAALAATFRWLGFNISDDETKKEAFHLIIAFCSGCFRSVFIFLGRLSEFDSKQVRSRRFLFTYGFTLPIIGGGFALVLAAVLDAKIITIFQNSI